jgi:hypothetical protein
MYLRRLSWVQLEKNSQRAYVVRSYPANGHKARRGNGLRGAFGRSALSVVGKKDELPKSFEKRMALIIRRTLAKPALPQRLFQYFRLSPKALVGFSPHSPRSFREGLRDRRSAAQGQPDFAGLEKCSAPFAAPLALVNQTQASATSDHARDMIELGGTPPAPKVNHRSAIMNPVKFGALLRAIESCDGQATTKAALQLMAILFPRPGELRMARWSEFDLAKAIWTIPAERTKMRRPHRVPLTPLPMRGRAIQQAA